MKVFSLCFLPLCSYFTVVHWYSRTRTRSAVVPASQEPGCRNRRGQGTRDAPSANTARFGERTSGTDSCARDIVSLEQRGAGPHELMQRSLLLPGATCPERATRATGTRTFTHATLMNATRAHAQRNESAVLTFVYLVFSSPSRLSASRPRPRCNPKAVMRQEKGSKVPRSNLPSIAAPLCLPSLAQPLDERCRRLLHLLELGRMPFDERGLLDQVDAVPIQGRAWQG